MLEARSLPAKVVLQLVATILVLPFLYPLVAMVQESLAGTGWNNYATVLAIPELPVFFRNSAIIAVCVIVIVYVCTMLASFAFSKLRFRGKEVLFWLMLAALTLPEVVILAPLFATASALGIYDTFIAVILPLAALQIPFTVLLTRNFVDGIPNDLLDAARVDGATTWKTFRYVVWPLTAPIGAAIVVLTLIGTWNDYLLPLVFLQDPGLQTVTLVPTFFVGEFNNDQTKVVAAAVVTAIPEIVAYLLLQRLFERGLSAGALK
ncbi:carbohydrate ABC transporter permease [Pseudolysinimonas kribbensis]